jgi:acetyl-CoA acetyltransferase
VRAALAGLGLTPFGKHPDDSLKTLAKAAIGEALDDAGLAPGGVDMAFVANAVAAITTGQVSVVGQTVLAESGIDGIPVYNIDNACAGSAAALNLATHALRAGVAERILVVGVEKLYHEDRAVTYRALNGAADIDWVRSVDVDPERESVFVKHVYADRLAAYAKIARLEPETLAEIAVKNRRHAATNALAQFRDPVTVDEVLAARVVIDPVTTLMCAPIGDGASAVVVAADGPVWVRGSAVSMGSRPGRSKTTLRRVAEAAYDQARIGPEDVDVAEVHDATAFGELLAYEELGLCEPGEGASLVAQGATSLGGRIPVNPSGGLESRGHPIAATGLAQVVELARQLRGEAGDRQVEGARVALAEAAGGFVAGDSASIAVHVLGVDPGN